MGRTTDKAGKTSHKTGIYKPLSNLLPEETCGIISTIGCAVATPRTRCLLGNKQVVNIGSASSASSSQANTGLACFSL